MRKWPFILALVLGLGVVAWVFAYRRPPQEMVFEGSTIKDWALQAYARDPQAESALKRAGATSVPGLARMLRVRDSWTRVQFWSLLPSLPVGVRLRAFKQAPPGQAVRQREAAAHALGLLGPVAVPAIPGLNRALRDRQGRVCWEAATALARIGPPALPVLLKATRDKTGKLRGLAAFGLGEMGRDAVQALPALSGLLEDTDESVRVWAAESLVLIGTDALMLTNGPTLPADPEARKNALAMRLQLDRLLPAYVTPLLSMAASPDPVRRERGVDLLASINVANHAVFNALTNALTDSDLQVRVAACNGLTRLGVRAASAIPLLTSNLAGSVPELRAASAQALGVMGPPAVSAVPQLQALRSDSEPKVRLAATQALARIQRHTVVPPATPE